MVFYDDVPDLVNKINDLKNDMGKINKISKKGKKRYFEIFNNLIVADSIISKTLHTTPKYNYAWEK